MTGKTFRRQVLVTVFALLISATITLWIGKEHCQLEVAKALIPVYIGAAAAWITFCLQRRIAHTNALRSLWERIVKTIQDSIQYTHLPSPDAAAYSVIVRDLGIRIDEIRGVFKNVDESYVRPPQSSLEYVLGVKTRMRSKIENKFQLLESDNKKVAHIFREHRANTGGVYPFESLKQIQSVISALGYGGSFRLENAVIARGTVIYLWEILRSELLKEMDRDHPEHPDTPYRRMPRRELLRRVRIRG